METCRVNGFGSFELNPEVHAKLRRLEDENDFVFVDESERDYVN